ncbi:reverse transcriptase domain-containing protein [Tanacetum coccineum]
MKRDIVKYVERCLTCLQVKTEHQRPFGKLKPLEIPVWKWEKITMDLITKLPKTLRQHDTIWVIVDRLTKSAIFLPIKESMSPDALVELYLHEVVAIHGVHVSIVSEHCPSYLQTDGQSERTIQTLEDMLRACAIDFGGSWDKKRGKLGPRYIVHYKIIDKVLKGSIPNLVTTRRGWNRSIIPFQAEYTCVLIRVSNDLWERIQLLMQGTLLTKQERECKLYDAFDKFAHIKGELLHQYYLRFTQLINDINIYKKKLEQFQVNTKFLNSLPPEWSKFMTDVKIVKDLHTTNFDQLNSYLEQHEIHANEVHIMRERSQDPLTLVANHQMTPSHLNTCQSSYNNPHTQSQRGKKDAKWFRDKVLLVEAQGSGKVLNKEELAFLADPRVAEGPVMQTIITHNAAYQVDDLDAVDSDCDEISTTKAVLMANLSKNEITSDSNIIPYSQYLLETQTAAVQDTNSSAQQDSMILSVFEKLYN